MQIFEWDTIDSKLVISHTESKSLADVEQVIALNKPIGVIDKFIELHILELDPAQKQSEDWYEQHTLVLTLDPNEPRKPIYDINGVKTGDEPNGYDIALGIRKSLETTNKWLKGLRGLVSAPARPLFTMTVADFKLANAKLLGNYNKSIAFTFNGVQCSVKEKDQNGWGSITTLLDLSMSKGAIFTPINFNNQNGNIVILNTRVEWDNFVLTGATARQAFFI